MVSSTACLIRQHVYSLAQDPKSGNITSVKAIRVAYSPLVIRVSLGLTANLGLRVSRRIFFPSFYS